MLEDIIQDAEQVASAYAAKDRSLQIVQNMVMRVQPPHENWQFVTTQTYALPGRWVYVVLLYADAGKTADGQLHHLRFKAEMVIGEEGQDGKLEYYLKSPFHR